MGFVRLDSRTLTLDRASIESAITPQTTAVVPVPCYDLADQIVAPLLYRVWSTPQGTAGYGVLVRKS